jgi:hypothetical protein
LIGDVLHVEVQRGDIKKREGARSRSRSRLDPDHPQETAASADSAGAIETIEAYTAFSPVDFQPHSHPEEASTLISLISNLG